MMWNSRKFGTEEKEEDDPVNGILDLLELDLENQLREGGFTGVVQDDAMCPVGRYLYSKIKNPVSLCHDSVYVFKGYSQADPSKKLYSLRDYPNIRQFLLEFDDGQHPEFEDKFPELIGSDH